MRTLVTNRHIVTAVDSYVADILVDWPVIAMIGSNLGSVVGQVDRAIDAAGRLVIPGGIDPYRQIKSVAR